MKLLFTIYFLCFCFNAFSKVEVCPDVVLHGTHDMELTDTEKNLICGDPKLNAYKNIPSYQASFFITGFLQSRGYLDPKFEMEKEVLHVDIGKKSKVDDVEVTGTTGKLKNQVKKITHRKFQNQVLNPNRLDAMEAEGLELIRQKGFPCAEVDSEVNALTSDVTMNLKNLIPHKFGEVKKRSIKGLEDNALLRFYPFEEDDSFNGRLLALTEKRMLRSEVVQGTYFLESCSEKGDEFSIDQEFILGPPRTFRFGVGASTEMGPMVRFRWSNNRFRPMASSLSANIQTSFRNQALTLTADLFLWKSRPRQSLYSQFEVMRESQFDYEETTIRFKPHMKWTRDGWGHHTLVTFGPTFESGLFRSTAESDPTNSYKTISIQGGWQWMAHDYELYNVHPEEGDLLNLGFDYRNPTLGFQTELLRLDTSYTRLLRLGYLGRGSFIGGFKLEAGTTAVDKNVPLITLPPSIKFYGGGSDDVRGFLLRTLPKNDGLGALTKAALKLETRKTHFFWSSLELFAFADGAYFGEESWALLPRQWYSPGVGLRWLSPIGLVQTYAARAYATRPNEDFGSLYFIGLGGAF